MRFTRQTLAIIVSAHHALHRNMRKEDVSHCYVLSVRVSSRRTALSPPLRMLRLKSDMGDYKSTRR